jgi:hypothetical protein
MTPLLRSFACVLVIAVSAYGCAPADVQQTGAASASPDAATSGGGAASGSATNRPPTISLPATSSAIAGQPFALSSSAADADGDVLTFDIANKPAWAGFDARSGRLSGTPGGSDVGATSGIVISVSDGRARVSAPAFTVAVQPAGAGAPGTTANRAPVVSGSPSATAAVGVSYVFSPSATDADGDALAFSIANRPSWATFDAATGRLSGTPVAGSVGTNASILISVSDGKSTSSLPAFSIVVSAVATTGSAIVDWDTPTTNLDGSALDDLASYRIVYGRASSSLTESVTVSDRAATTYEVVGLASGTWYFGVKAVNRAGRESPLSNLASKAIP